MTFALKKIAHLVFALWGGHEMEAIKKSWWNIDRRWIWIFSHKHGNFEGEGRDGDIQWSGPSSFFIG